MTKSTTKQLTVGAQQSVFCATAGLALYLSTALIGGDGDVIGAIKMIGSMFAQVPFEAAFCLIVFYSWAWSAGRFAGARIRRNLENNDSGNYLIGIGLAFSTVAVGFLAVCLAAVLRQTVTDGIEPIITQATFGSFAILLYLLLLTGLLGSIPAIFLEVIYTCFVEIAVRRELRLEI